MDTPRVGATATYAATTEFWSNTRTGNSNIMVLVMCLQPRHSQSDTGVRISTEACSQYYNQGQQQ